MMMRTSTALACGTLCAFAHAVPPSTQPMYPGTHVLSNEELVVEVMDPSDAARYYRGVRFTPVAAVIRVADDQEWLYHNGADDPQKAAAGLFGEFDLSSTPPGFAEAKLGEPFIKVGVGALTKTRTDYFFDAAYPVARLADTTAIWNRDRVQFSQTLPDVDGFAYRLEATVELQGRLLTIRYTLTNTGSRRIQTEQYLHNCFRFGVSDVGEGYQLRLPFEPHPPKIPAALKIDGRDLTISGPLVKPANLTADWPDAERTGGLEVVFPNGVRAIRVGNSAPISRLAVHMARQYFCPEQFVRIDLAAGETYKWDRTFEFVQEKPK